ncbi:RlpA Lipoproteins [Oxalobacteraceae bacterium]
MGPFYRCGYYSGLVLCAATLLSSCTTIDLSEPRESDRRAPVTRRPPPSKSTTAPSASTTTDSVPPVSQSPSTSGTRKPGGYYLDDGPDERIPEGLLDTPDAEPRIEPYAKGPSRPYTIFDQTYVPITDNRPFVQRGIGSWYGKKFHGQRTASGEIYDMYKMTAAHTTLPIPCYARVTNLRNGKQVIVRINDRGPFHSSRIIDLSYTAALKLGYVQNGSSELEVERLRPEEIKRMQALRRADDSLAAKPVAADEIDAIVRPVNAPASSAVAVEAGGFFLQFGAFSQAHNAASLRERLLSTWPENLPRPELVQSQGLYRLHSGPFNTRELADRAAQALKSSAQLQPTVVQK